MSSATTTLEQPLSTLRLSGAPAPALSPSGSASPWPTAPPAGVFPGAPYPGYKYEKFLPYYDATLQLPPLEPFTHVDPGLAALEDAEPRAFLGGAEEKRLTPDFGSEVSGVQLRQLDAKGKSQLALYVAQRGVVVFRGQQDFIDADPNWQLHEWGATFGRLHIHPTSGQPKHHPELHLVYRDAKPKDTFLAYDSEKLSLTQWHSDVTYEEQPPGLTTLFLYHSPPTGGDTAYVSQVEAYNRLSPSFRSYLETLSAVHSGFEQAAYSRAGNRGGVVKRAPIETVHPLVRRHPVTGKKALFVNKQFTRRIVGLKTEESEAILNLIYTHLAMGHDFQVRAGWEPGTVVLWDNRVTAHTAIGDYRPELEGFRHGARITPQAERPSL